MTLNVMEDMGQLKFLCISSMKGKGHKTLEKISTSRMYSKEMTIPFHKKVFTR